MQNVDIPNDDPVYVNEDYDFSKAVDVLNMESSTNSLASQASFFCMRENGLIFVNNKQSLKIRKRFIDMAMNRRQYGENKISLKKYNMIEKAILSIP